MVEPISDAALARLRHTEAAQTNGTAIHGLIARLDAAEADRDALRAALRELRDAAEGLDGLSGGSGGRYARALLEAGRLLGEGPC